MSATHRIAIIGSGIAGLGAAWLLGREHEVTLFERHDAPGMGAFNISLETAGGCRRIDVPLRVFKAGYYANLCALYRAAGVAMQASDHAAVYYRGDGPSPYFRYRNLHLGRWSLPLVAARNIGALAIAREVLRFQRQGRADLAAGRAAGVSLAGYLEARPFSDAFVEGVLLPTFAAIATCSYADVRRYPAEAIIDFFTRGSLLSGIWRARFGADDAVARLLAPVQQVRCHSEVVAIHPGPEGVAVRRADGSEQHFDLAVLAVQAHQARELVAGQDPHAAALLARIPHVTSEVVVHSAPESIPGGITPGSPVSYLVAEGQAAPMASIHLNAVVPALAAERPLFQTWNPLREPRADAVLGRARFERPLVSLDSQAAVADLGRLQSERQRRLHYCGSYAMPGIPLLESAVQSAMAIAERLGAPAPWADSGTE